MLRFDAARHGDGIFSPQMLMPLHALMPLMTYAIRLPPPYDMSSPARSAMPPRR